MAFPTHVSNCISSFSAMKMFYPSSTGEHQTKQFIGTFQSVKIIRHQERLDYTEGTLEGVAKSNIE